MEVDAKCHCERCEARTKETYSLTAVCLNCGMDNITITFRKGDKAIGGSLGPRCPRCEVCNLMLRR